jgi:hypothetical protein
MKNHIKVNELACFFSEKKKKKGLRFMIGSKKRRLDSYGPEGQAKAHLNSFFLRRSTTCHPTFFLKIK